LYPLLRQAAFLGCVALLIWGLAPAPLRLTVLADDWPNVATIQATEERYYEGLIGPHGLERGGDGGERAAGPRAPWMLDSVDDIREYVLKSNLDILVAGQRFRTNSVGMRGREVLIPKPAGVVRVGIAGDSIAAGWGAPEGRHFAALLESVAESAAGDGPRIEVVNCSVPGHSPIQRWAHFRLSGWRYNPDIVIFESSPADFGWDARRLMTLLPRGVGFEEPAVASVFGGAMVGGSDSAVRARRVLERERVALLAEGLAVASRECRARGVGSIWVLVPRVGRPIDPRERRMLLQLAARAGFDKTIDLTSIFDALDRDSLAAAPNDYHPNALGHQHIYSHLVDPVRAMAAEIGARRAMGAWSGEGGER
jgi:hypothetical protein